MHKRKFLILVLLLITSAIFLAACFKTVELNKEYYYTTEPELNIGNKEGDLTLRFLSVGACDATLINLPDGKTMLVGCGYLAIDYLIDLIKALKISLIDYFVLPYPDMTETAAVNRIFSEFEVETAYLPYLKNPEAIIGFSELYAKISNSSKVKYSEQFDVIEGANYKFTFLSPSSIIEADGEYAVLETDGISSKNLKNTSAVLFLEYFNKKVVLSGAEDATVQNKIADDYELFKELGIDFFEVDIFKVSDGGAADSMSQRFLSLLKPKTAVISVGKNSRGLPSSVTLTKLLKSNEDIKILRTDYDGTVSAVLKNDDKKDIELYYGANR